MPIMKTSISLFQRAEALKKAGELAEAAQMYREAAGECATDAAFRIAVGRAEEIEAKLYPKTKGDK